MRNPRLGAAVALLLVSLLLASCGYTASRPGAASASNPPSLPTTGSSSTTSTLDWMTTSSTTLFPSQQVFTRELSGDGYQTAIVFTDRAGGTTSTVVWVLLDPDKVTPASYDAIFDQAVALAKKYRAADSTGGRLRVGLCDAAPGEYFKDHIVESRDFDLRSTTSLESTTVTTKLFPAVDKMLGWLRLDVNPREGVRVAVGGLREIPSDTLDPRKRLIEGEVIIENRSDTPFACGPNDFRLYVGPFQTQIEGMTASTDFPVHDAILAPTPVEGHTFMVEGAVSPGDTLHGYLLTWIADRGTESYGLQYDPSDAEARKVGRGYMFRIQP